MPRLRLTNLGNRITLTAVAISVGTVVIVYLYTVTISGAGGAVRGEILVGGLIAVAVATALGLYYAQLAARNISRLQDAARKVADGNFETTIPIASAGQLGQLARTFNEMQRRLAELDSARKQFIANASHELRTPIFSLGGFIELLEEEDPSPEERAEFVRTMRQQIERLTKLTVDLLDLSQLDAGAMVMHPRGVDLGALAREVTREFGARADLRGSRLQLRTPEEPAIAPVVRSPPSASMSTAPVGFAAIAPFCSAVVASSSTPPPAVSFMSVPAPLVSPMMVAPAPPRMSPAASTVTEPAAVTFASMCTSANLLRAVKLPDAATAPSTERLPPLSSTDCTGPSAKQSMQSPPPPSPPLPSPAPRASRSTSPPTTLPTFRSPPSA